MSKWSCPLCENLIECNCRSENCHMDTDIRSHLLTHECYCDPCNDPDCKCRTQRCQVCVARSM